MVIIDNQYGLKAELWSIPIDHGIFGYQQKKVIYLISQIRFDRHDTTHDIGHSSCELTINIHKPCLYLSMELTFMWVIYN